MALVAHPQGNRATTLIRDPAPALDTPGGYFRLNPGGSSLFHRLGCAGELLFWAQTRAGHDGWVVEFAFRWELELVRLDLSPS